MWTYVVYGICGLIALAFMGTMDRYLEKIRDLLIEVRDSLKRIESRLGK
jgi:hypothetical protein